MEKKGFGRPSATKPFFIAPLWSQIKSVVKI